jgi:protein-disulfide isomerase
MSDKQTIKDQAAELHRAGHEALCAADREDWEAYRDLCNWLSNEAQRAAYAVLKMAANKTEAKS